MVVGRSGRKRWAWAFSSVCERSAFVQVICAMSRASSADRTASREASDEAPNEPTKVRRRLCRSHTARENPCCVRSGVACRGDSLATRLARSAARSIKREGGRPRSSSPAGATPSLLFRGSGLPSASVRGKGPVGKILLGAVCGSTGLNARCPALHLGLGFFVAFV